MRPLRILLAIFGCVLLLVSAFGARLGIGSPGFGRGDLLLAVSGLALVAVAALGLALVRGVDSRPDTGAG